MGIFSHRVVCGPGLRRLSRPAFGGNQILEDTLLGFRLAPWGKARRRRLIETEKFYLFDVGVANYLARRTPREGTPEFGKAFEQHLLLETRAYQAYVNPELDIHYWRTSTGLEVDCILGDMAVAIQVKAGRVHEGDLPGLKGLLSEHKVKRALIVSMESQRRKIRDGIEILPWPEYLKELWSGALGT